MHPLLERQLRRIGWTGENAAIDIGKLLTLIDAVYCDIDRERRLSDRSMELMNEELMALNRRIAAQAHDRLASAVDGISAAIALFDESDRLIICNRTYREIHPAIVDILRPGVTFETIVRSNVAHHRFDLGPDDAEDYIQWRLEQHRGASQPIERRLSDGRWELVCDEPMTGGGRVLIITDMTERKWTEEALLAAKTAADAANQAKSLFLANMSHELRTPLNAIIGFSDVLASEMFGPLGEPRYTQYARDILTSGNHLLNIINDILDLSKIDAGKFELNETQIEIAPTIENAMLLVRGRAVEGRIETVLERIDHLPALFADERAVQQILINLLSNAIKFTPAGGRVTIKADLSPDNRMRLAVSDSGIGMAPADISKALEPFQQLDTGLERRHEGTGLGLPLCQRLVELHGGELRIASKPGVGTTVTVIFPAERNVVSQPNQATG